MNSNKLIAIDLGSSRISAMAVEIQVNGALKILAEESKISDDVKWGIVEQVSGAAFKVNELVKLLQNSSKVTDIQQVCVSVGAKSMKQIPVSITRFVGSSKIVTNQLISSILDECESKFQQPDLAIFDLIPLSYVLDGKRMDDPIGQRGSQITANYNAIVGNSLINSELERCFDRTGIVLEYRPLVVEALSTALLDEQEREAGCALINFGATTTTLAVYSQGALQCLLVVPLGGKNITRDIQELGISEANAERLKCLKGVAMEQLVLDPMYVQIPSVETETPVVRISTQFLATIIEARLDEMLQPIFSAISELPFSLDAGIIITGGGSKLANITEFITDKTTIYTRFGDHSEWLYEGTPQRFNDPCYAQLVGTVLLTHEYRKDHPVEITQAGPEKKPKILKRRFKDRIADSFLKFFEDDNALN